MESLGNYSFYSFYGSLLSPRKLAELAYSLGYRTVGVADWGGFWGAVEFSQACRQMGIRPVLGCRLKLEQVGEVQLTVKNTDGYRALSRYLTLWPTPSPGPRRDRGESDGVELAAFQQFWGTFGGHFHLSVRPSPQPKATNETSDWVIWKRAWDELLALLGPEIWIELQWATSRERELQQRVFRELRPLTDRWVAMGGARCATAEQWEALRVLQSIGTLTRVSQPHPDKLNPGNYALIGAEALRRRFGKTRQVLEQTRRFAHGCHFDFEYDRLWLPHLQRPDAETTAATGETAEEEMEKRNRLDYRQLRYLCLRGIVSRYVKEPYPWKNKPSRAALLERIRRELDLIRETGYAGYFLIFYDIARACVERGIPVLARGSAAGSLVCYSLGVSNVCPFRFQLNFERFLNRERLKHSKLPDIDLDLPWDRRDEIIAYVYRKYGDRHVAMVGGSNTFKNRAAIAEVAKTMGASENEARHMTRYLPRNGMEKLLHERNMSLENKGLERDERFRSILKTASFLDGLPRHPMMHPCGIVVADRPLTDFTPLLPSRKGFIMTQMSMEPIEDLGLLKLDLLGQAGLSVIRDTCENLRQDLGVFEPLQDIDYYDAEIFAMIARGGARGVFHIESPAMTGLLRMCQCADIDCLVGTVSVIRPGAANEGKKTSFARRYLGLEKPHYAHPDLEPILNDCFGLMVYEEHILLVAHDWAGVDLGRADLMRRILGKKRKGGGLREMKEEFYACARKKGRDEKAISTVWKLLAEFSGYMFNKAHGAAYAVEAFQGAYLKKRYPGYFLTAVLQSGRGFYSPLVYVLELLRLGYRFELPRVTRLSLSFKFSQGVVYYPLSRIAGLSRKFLGEWSAALRKGPFRDWDDFLGRTLPEPADLLMLAKAGALRDFFANRYEAVWQAGRYRRDAYVGHSERLLQPEPDKREPFPFQPQEPEGFARWEAQLFGYPITLSPFALWLKGIDRMGTVPIDQLEDCVGREVEIAGIIVAARNIVTLNGKPMKFVSIADETEIAEVILFPGTYRRMAYQVSRSQAIRIRVWVKWDKTERSVTAQGVDLVATDTPR